MLELRECTSPEWDQAFSIALAPYPDEARFPIDLRDCQLHQFGDAQAGRVQNFEHSLVAHAERGSCVWHRDQCVHLFLGRDVGQWATKLGQMEQRGWIFPRQFVFPLEKTVQPSKRG